MDEKQKILSLKNFGDDVALTVSRATVRMNSVRIELTLLADKMNENSDDPARIKQMRAIIYPDLIAATSEVTGIPWPLDFDSFLDLDSSMVDGWLNGVYTLNPHWAPQPIPEMEGAAGENPKQNQSHRHGSKKKSEITSDRQPMTK